jgi:hypothetical protein
VAWYVTVEGQVFGPADDAEVISWIHTRNLSNATICRVGGQSWSHLTSHPPFASALRQAAPPPPPPPGPAAAAFVQARSNTKATKKPTDPKLKLVLWIVGLMIGAVSWPGPGLVVGLGLIGFSEFARRKQRPSFVSWVLKRAPSAVQGIASLTLGCVLALEGGSRLVNDWLTRHSIEQEAEAHAADLAKQHTALLAQVPQLVAGWRTKLGPATSASEATAFVDGNMPQVDGVIADAKALASRLGSPIPAELSKLQSDATSVREKYAAREDFEGRLKGIDQNVAAAQNQLKTRQWLAADDDYADALGNIDALGKAPPWLQQLLPQGFDLAAKAKEVTAMRSQIAAPVAAEKARVAREQTARAAREEKEETARKAQEAKKAAYAAVCGEQPTVSGWDGALIGLESALKETANDPDSIDVKNCTQPGLSGDNCWVSTCDVRGKNAFGAKILRRLTFSKSALGYQQLGD